MPWLTQDRDRLRRFREGDRVVLGEVFSAYAPGLARTLAGGLRLEARMSFRGGATPSDTDDLLQETFMKAFTDRARAAYDGVRPYSGYLVGIAKNVLLEWYRTDCRRARLFDATARDDAPAASAESRLMATQLAGLVGQFLAALPEGDRTLVQLRILGGATRREVTERTGYSAMRVRLREPRLRRELLAAIEAAGYDLPPAGDA